MKILELEEMRMTVGGTNADTDIAHIFLPSDTVDIDEALPHFKAPNSNKNFDMCR